ncbi:ISAs1 family transposase [Streptomyces sp. HNM0663]|uniref:ISAs1 family transposase n=1 Tax=Streptomyces chengmaiensis TaxID=3040919 RepID=A0ABT6HZF8_9ACTN|nr:ISAs1 family transposase [Streptomyces chengmaiensis]MDH2393648.1 ISAs1 family transposase [Streptomyces chengmaiensis]
MACGFDTFRAIGQWARRADQDTLARLGCRPRGPFGLRRAPSAATVRRVVAGVMPGGLEQLLRVLEFGDDLRLLAVDGKTLRGSFTRDHGPVQVLGAMSERGHVLAQQAVPDKTNEIPGFAPLLHVLDLAGTVITADALHTQRGHAQVIVEEFGGHYVFTVKNNQRDLYAACQKIPWDEVQGEYRRTDRGHGRTDTRAVKAVTWEGLDFPHLRQVARIIRWRYSRITGRRSKETVYVITSLPSRLADPCRIGEIVRSHWGVENSGHYVRDVTFREDASRVRTGFGAQNMALLRSITLNFLRLMGMPIADARRELALQPHTAPLELFGHHL